MAVQRVTDNRFASNLYIFNNNYRQVDKTAVTPVKPVKKLPGFTGRGDNKELAAVYQHDNKMSGAQGTKQIDAIRDEYVYLDKASYDTDNMYERQRMSAESTVLLGMNVDTFA